MTRSLMFDYTFSIPYIFAWIPIGYEVKYKKLAPLI